MISELDNQNKSKRYPLPPGKKVTANELLERFGEAPDFPTIEEIRAKAWPSKW
jgi:hypothetical protein